MLKFEIMRETNSVCSKTSTQEYELIKQLTPKLRTAIQDDLQGISEHLLSCGMITEENYQDFTNWASPLYVRAKHLVQTVQNRIKLDSRYFYDFIQVLEKKREYYSSILLKIHSHDLRAPHLQHPPYSESQHHSCSDEESQSEEESSCEGESSSKHRGVKSGRRSPSLAKEALSYCGLIIICFAGILYFVIGGIMFLVLFPLCYHRTFLYIYILIILLYIFLYY